MVIASQALTALIPLLILVSSLAPPDRRDVVSQALIRRLVASTIYMPRLMDAYSERYGIFGVTLALVGWLLCVALILVIATVVAAEFDRSQGRLACRFRVRLGVETTSDGHATEA
jgi:hypothetical protein